MPVAPATVLSPGVAAPLRSPAQALRRGLLSGLIVAAVGAALALLGLKLAGWQSLTVLTGSMQPTIAPGQVVVVSPQAATAIRAGQVITFDRPRGPGTLTHRVQTVTAVTGGGLEVTTKGDANRGSETWRIRQDGTVGLHRATLPRIGGAISMLVAGPGRPYLVAGVTLVAVLLVLGWIWKPELAPDPGGPASTAGGETSR